MLTPCTESFNSGLGTFSIILGKPAGGVSYIMAGLWRTGVWNHTTQVQSVACTLVLSCLMHHCLASYQQPFSASATQRGDTTAAEAIAAAAEDINSPQQLTSLRHILKRSATTGAAATSASNARDSSRTSIEMKLAHNFTDVNTLFKNPPSSATADNRMVYDIQNTAPGSLRTELESSGSKEDFAAADLPEVQVNEFLKVKTTNIDTVAEDTEHPTRTQPQTTTVKPDSDNIACPGCVKRQRKLSQLDPEALRHIRIETIKMQILSKLRFEKPPNVTKGEMNIPAPLSDGQFGGGEEELIDFSAENELGDKNRYYAKTTQVIITAKDDDMYCPTKSRNAGCFEFDLSQAAGMNVISAELWVYRMASPNEDSLNHTLVVSQLASRHSRIKKELLRQTVSLHEAGWLTFDMKHKVQNMINHSQRQQRLEIHCEDCNENDFPISSKTGYKPFLAISTSEPSPRTPRSIDCSDDTADCCRERFFVSFAEIGWDWIIQPKGYYANYCKGSCVGPVIPGYAHTSVIHGVIERDEHLHYEMMPCCAPKKTKGISLIYYDNDELIYRRELPEMIIESCACS